MTDQNSTTNRPAQPETSDEHQLLCALLQQLEQADDMSLDELEAMVMKVDTAYKSRLARLERVRQMIEHLGTPGATQ